MEVYGWGTIPALADRGIVLAGKELELELEELELELEKESSPRRSYILHLGRGGWTCSGPYRDWGLGYLGMWVR